MEVFKDALGAVAFGPEKLRKTNLFDTPRMFCDVYGLEPGQEQAGHAHADADKIYFVLDGTGTFRVGDAERNLGPGHAILAPAGATHAVRNAGSERLALLVFMAPKP
ncbi:cupin domain-containing protein [Candidatus Binatia bacterium]|nr:cupin domain-containing protein [Candidatus Binatia bacterium]